MPIVDHIEFEGYRDGVCCGVGYGLQTVCTLGSDNHGSRDINITALAECGVISHSNSTGCVTMPGAALTSGI